MLLLSNTTLSFTLYPSPDFKISNESIDPWLTDVTLVVCDNISFDSIIKSLFANESDNLTYKGYYQYLIKHINENIDEDEEIDKETFSLFINQYSIDEDEFIEEINTFCTERYDELLLEENNATNTFEISKEVFENFKLAFN